MLTQSELSILSDLLDKVEADLKKKRAPKTIATRASDMRLAVEWLVKHNRG